MWGMTKLIVNTKLCIVVATSYLSLIKAKNIFCTLFGLKHCSCLCQHLQNRSMICSHSAVHDSGCMAHDTWIM